MTRGKAIDLKCKDCIYDPLDSGTWRAQVEACTCTERPLFVFRPKTYVKRTVASIPDTDREAAA